MVKTLLPLSGALGSLVSAYGSDDSDSSAEEGEIKDDEPIKSGGCVEGDVYYRY